MTSTGSATHTDAATVAAITAVEDRRRRAVVAVDLAELREIFADDLVHIHSTGLTHDRPSLLAHIDQKRAFLSVDRGELHIRVMNDVAIVVGPLHNRMRTPDGGEIVLDGVATQILRHDDRGWRFMHFQLTPAIPNNEDKR